MIVGCQRGKPSQTSRRQRGKTSQRERYKPTCRHRTLTTNTFTKQCSECGVCFGLPVFVFGIPHLVAVTVGLLSGWGGRNQKPSKKFMEHQPPCMHINSWSPLKKIMYIEAHALSRAQPPWPLRCCRRGWSTANGHRVEQTGIDGLDLNWLELESRTARWFRDDVPRVARA